MPTDEQTNDVLTTSVWPSFESVYKSLVKLIDSTPEDRKFPKQKLRNRLINIGLREFLDGIGENNSGERALEVYGFPFKFVTQLDEAILATAHFLNRFSREPGSVLNFYALHRLSKGEEKNLSFWQSPKAKLYTELQNIILLLNDVGERKSTITRILTFSKLADLAFLTQPAISVLSEQVAAKINVGFLFLETFENERDQKIGPVSNTVLIDFTPGPTESDPAKTDTPANDPHTFHFFVLRGLFEEKKAHDLPYQDRCTAKWFRSKEDAFAAENHLSSDVFAAETHLSNLVKLFNTDNWSLISRDPKGISKFHQDGRAIFNSATLMMHRAFTRSKTSIQPSDFVRRVNDTVITSDLIRLDRAIAAFDDEASNDIWAVDATSVKDTLKIHESNPTYRHWLRRSLNRVLSSDGKRLERIYILKDDHKENANTATEFQTLTREMQYYLDYLNYEISEMTDILRAHEMHGESATEKDTLASKCNTFKDRIHVYITTSSILKAFASQTLVKTVHPAMLLEILKSPRKADGSEDIPSVLELLTTLDFLFTEGEQGMIYNFLNQRADPGELKFDAFLYRSSFDDELEEKLLFDIVYSDTFDYLENETLDQEKMDLLKDWQLQSRMRAFADALLVYAGKYKFILEKQLKPPVYQDSFKSLKEYLKSLKEKVENNSKFEEGEQTRMLEIRKEFESALYVYFKEKFLHLFELVRYHSVEVVFFRDLAGVPDGERWAARRIEDIYPFNSCKGTKPKSAEEKEVTPSEQLFDLIGSEVLERLKDAESIPRFSKRTKQEPLKNKTRAGKRLRR